MMFSEPNSMKNTLDISSENISDDMPVDVGMCITIDVPARMNDRRVVIIKSTYDSFSNDIMNRVNVNAIIRSRMYMCIIYHLSFL